MYKPIKNIEDHIYDTLKVSSIDKREFLYSVYIEGYKVLGCKKILICSIIGFNNPLNGCHIEKDLDDIIEYLYYDDDRELDYYGDYSIIQDLMYPQIDEDTNEIDLYQNQIQE